MQKLIDEFDHLIAKFREQINRFAKIYDRVKRLNHRIWHSKPKTEYGITARAKQTYTSRLVHGI